MQSMRQRNVFMMRNKPGQIVKKLGRNKQRVKKLAQQSINLKTKIDQAIRKLANIKQLQANWSDNLHALKKQRKEIQDKIETELKQQSMLEHKVSLCCRLNILETQGAFSIVEQVIWNTRQVWEGLPMYHLMATTCKAMNNALKHRLCGMPIPHPQKSLLRVGDIVSILSMNDPRKSIVSRLGLHGWNVFKEIPELHAWTQQPKLLCKVTSVDSYCTRIKPNVSDVVLNQAETSGYAYYIWRLWDKFHPINKWTRFRVWKMR